MSYPETLPSSRLKLVLDVSRLLAVVTDLPDLLRGIAEASTRLLQCERSSIWVHDPATGELRTAVALGCDDLRVRSDVGIVGCAFTANDAVHVPDAYADHRFDPTTDRLTGFVTTSLLAVPMVDIDGKPVGVIQAVNKCGGGSFTADDLALGRLLAQQAGVAIQRQELLNQVRATAELHREMQLARRVQQQIIPRTFPAFPGYDIAGTSQSASVTGGDCHDVWTLPDGRLGVFVADASGHGLAPTLVILQARTLVRAFTVPPQPRPTPQDVLAQVNRRLSADLEPTRFVTAFLAFISPDGTVDWQSAGHGPILYRPSPDAAMQSFNAPVPMLNADSELIDEPPPPLRLEPGGQLIVATDGIFESFDPTGNQFGTRRVVDSIETTSSQVVVDKLMTAVRAWQTHDQPADDQTLLVIRRLAGQ